MDEMYMLVTDRSASAPASGEQALFRLEEDAVKECLRVQSVDIDREYAPLQLYACDRGLEIDYDSKTVRLAHAEETSTGRTLMLVSHPLPRQAVIVISTSFEEGGSGSGVLIRPFIEMLKGEPLETLSAEAARLLREKTEQSLLKKDDPGMTYEDMLDLLL